MKKLMMAFFAVTLMLAVGCSDSPTDVFENLKEGMQDGDAEAIAECLYGNPMAVKVQAVAMAEMSKKMSAEELEKEMNEAVVVSEEIKGDKAVLTLQNGDKIRFKMVDGKWKMVR